MLTLSCAAGVQALQRLARAAYARLEPIRLDQVSHSRDIQRRVRLVKYTRRHAAACGFQNDRGRSILMHPRHCVSAGAILCTLCTAGTYSTGTGRWVLAMDSVSCVHACACVCMYFCVCRACFSGSEYGKPLSLLISSLCIFDSSFVSFGEWLGGWMDGWMDGDTWIWAVQGLRVLARAACAWPEPIRPDQVGHSRISLSLSLSVSLSVSVSLSPSLSLSLFHLLRTNKFNVLFSVSSEPLPPYSPRVT